MMDFIDKMSKLFISESSCKLDTITVLCKFQILQCIHSVQESCNLTSQHLQMVVEVKKGRANSCSMTTPHTEVLWH